MPAATPPKPPAWLRRLRVAALVVVTLAPLGMIGAGLVVLASPAVALVVVGALAWLDNYLPVARAMRRRPPTTEE